MLFPSLNTNSCYSLSFVRITSFDEFMAACITHALYQDSLVELLNCSMPESLNCLLLSLSSTN